ncbi:MAG: periplasmic heavy metal sensor, partial [Comamonadaceae bacterium]
VAARDAPFAAQLRRRAFAAGRQFTVAQPRVRELQGHGLGAAGRVRRKQVRERWKRGARHSHLPNFTAASSPRDARRPRCAASIGEPMSNPDQDRASPDNLRRRWFAGLAALGGIGLLGASAQAHGWRRHGGMDGEHAARRIQRRIERLVAYVGGTAQQQERLMAIATTALADLRPLRDQRRAARVRGLDLLAAPTIDRAALEQARAAQMQVADAASRRMAQAMADAAEVLTPEQRGKAVERMKRRMENRRGR